MSKRLTYEYVKSYIESNKGYRLLSRTYSNRNKELSIECPENHKWNVTFASFRAGNRCSTCGGTKKKTLEEAKLLFEKQGYSLLDKEYVNSKHKMKLLCPKKHTCFINYRSFDEGTRCTYCSGRRRKAIKEVQAIYKNAGHILLDKEFKNNRTRMRSICPKGHLCFASYSAFVNSKNKCKECAGCKTKDINNLYREFKKHGYTLLSKEYINAHSNLIVLCPSGHKYKTSYNSFFTKNNRCLDCSKIKKKTFQEVEHMFAQEGYACLSKQYINATKKMNLICPNGHRCSLPYYTFNNGHRCPYCAEKGFDPGKPANLYYLRFKINQQYFYKIGITNRPIQARISEFPFECSLIWHNSYLFGKMAYEDEQSILKKFNKFRCKDSGFKFNGSSELFVRDILKKDISDK